ncbi:hypothetical protein O3M35_009856 [Rhynocoris fuscipes]|uniref:PH domain-containing protein n=1 Tax=Rhynocoris fuscipes TaxID=488301 RepID=A0AAW1D571_9HEMI
MDYTAIIEGSVKFRDGKKWKSRWCVVRKISPVADDLRGSYLHARDSIVPRDVFLEGRTGFGHSSIFSDMQASKAKN